MPQHQPIETTRPARRAVISVACDACRSRKVRCDATAPRCGNCRLYDCECKYETPRRRRGPRPTRTGQQPARTVSPTPPLSRQRHDGLGALPTVPINLDSSQSTIIEDASSLPRLRSTTAELLQEDDSNLMWPCQTILSGHALAQTSALTAVHIQGELVATLAELATDPKQLVATCIEKFMQYRLPLLPALSLESLATTVPLLCEPLPVASDVSIAALGDTQLSLDDMRSFASLSAVCALAATVPQGQTLTPESDTTLAEKFVSASRRMLSCYADLDLEHPESSSLIIRFLQSNTLHYLGRTSLAMHLLRSAFSLAVSLRIYDEDSLAGIDPIEAHKRRVVFWALYQGDQSSSVLNDVPSLMVEVWLGQPITLAELNCPEEGILIGRDHALLGGAFEAQMLTGFKLSTQLWAAGADIFLDMRLLQRARERDKAAADGVASPSTLSLMSSYMTFHRLLDGLPSYLRDPDTATTDSANATKIQRRAFWTQRANLLITFHCIELTIIRRAQNFQLCNLLGLTHDGPMLAMRKMNVAGDMLDAARSVRFEALQGNGEPCVRDTLGAYCAQCIF